MAYRSYHAWYGEWKKRQVRDKQHRAEIDAARTEHHDDPYYCERLAGQPVPALYEGAEGSSRWPA
jgi:hypothetical protein